MQVLFDIPNFSCIMQLRAENQNLVSALSNYQQILYQFFDFTQNLKQSLFFSVNVTKILDHLSTSAVNLEDLKTRAIVFCVTSSCMVFLLDFLLLYFRYGGTYSLCSKYFIFLSFPLLDILSKSSVNAKRAATNLYGL